MGIVAVFICAFLLFMGAPCHAADDTPPTVTEKPAAKNKYKSTAKNKSTAKDKPPAKAKESYAISLTPMAGEYIFDSQDKLKSGQIYGLRLSCDLIGSQMLDSLGIDVVAGYIDTTSTVDNSKAKVYHFRLDATYPFIIKNSNFTPFLAVGAGGNFYERGDATDSKAIAGYGGGLKYKLLDYLAIRADVRHLIVFTPERADNVELTAGLTYTFGVERKPKPEESDKNKKEKQKQEKEKIEKEKIQNDHKTKNGTPPAEPEKPGDSPAPAKAETGGKGPGEKAPEIGRKPKGQESPTSAESVSSATVSAKAGIGQTSALQSATAGRSEAGQAGSGATGQPIAGTTIVTKEGVTSRDRDAAPIEPRFDAANGIAKVATEPATQGLAGKASEAKSQLREESRKIAPESPAAVPTEKTVAVTAITKDVDGVEIRTSAPIEAFRYFKESKPARLVIELPGTSNQSGKNAVVLGTVGIAGARLDTSEKALRLVFDTDWGPFQRFRVEKTDNGLKVSLVGAGEETTGRNVPEASSSHSTPETTESAGKRAVKSDAATAVQRPVATNQQEKMSAPAESAKNETPSASLAETKAVAKAPAERPAKEAAPAAEMASASATPPMITTAPAKPGVAMAEAAPAVQSTVGKALSAKPSKSLETREVSSKKEIAVPAEPAGTPVGEDVKTATARAVKAPFAPGAVAPGEQGTVKAEAEPAVTSIAAVGNGLEIVTSAPIATFSYFTMSEPARLVIDVPGGSNKSGKNTVPLGTMGITGARLETFEEKLRVVFDAEQELIPRFRVEKTENGLKVSLVESGEGSHARGVIEIPDPSPASETVQPAPAPLSGGKVDSGTTWVPTWELFRK